MTRTKDQIFSIDNLIKIKDLYNNKDAKYADLFVLEKFTVNKIVSYIASCDNLAGTDFKKIESLYNEIVGQKHHAGSPWFDFKIRLNYFFTQFNYLADWDNKTKKLTIKKKTGK